MSLGIEGGIVYATIDTQDFIQTCCLPDGKQATQTISRLKVRVGLRLGLAAKGSLYYIGSFGFSFELASVSATLEGECRTGCGDKQPEACCRFCATAGINIGPTGSIGFGLWASFELQGRAEVRICYAWGKDCKSTGIGFGVCFRGHYEVKIPFAVNEYGETGNLCVGYNPGALSDTTLADL